MRLFDYRKFIATEWDSEILSYIGKIHEYKGRQDFYMAKKSQDFAVAQRLIQIFLFCRRREV